MTLTEWRGEHCIELREAVATIPDCFFPSANGVVLDVALLPELIAALRAAQAQTVRLGLTTPKIEDTANAAPADSSARHQHNQANRKD